MRWNLVPVTQDIQATSFSFDLVCVFNRSVRIGSGNDWLCVVKNTVYDSFSISAS